MIIIQSSETFPKVIFRTKEVISSLPAEVKETGSDGELVQVVK